MGCLLAFPGVYLDGGGGLRYCYRVPIVGKTKEGLRVGDRE